MWWGMWLGCGAFVPTAEVTSVELSNVAMTQAEVTAWVDVTNPWWSPFTIDALTWSMTVGGAALTAGELKKAVFVRPNGITAVDVPLTFAYSDLASLPGALGGPEVPFALAVDVHATTPGGPWHWPLAIEGAIPKLSAPTLDLVDWSTQVQDGNLEVDVVVKLGLPQGFSLHDGSWKVTVDEHRIGEGSFAADPEGPLHLGLVVDATGTGRAGWSWLEGSANALVVDLSGSVRTPAGIVPLQLNQALAVGGEAARNEPRE